MPRRLIEEAFPLKKVSEDSKHEKNVKHGHISSLHVWPARRPLAACRAVTLATLLPDPADAPEKMKAEYTRLSGSPLPEKQQEYLCNDLIASLTRWGDENGHADWDAKDKNGRWLNKLRIARELILMAYSGDPPKVMDMFAGGGAIPLEAMRLGCKTIANDYNPVAWFILKCTLEYPQRLAGKTYPHPNLNLDEKPDVKNGNLADHVRLWGQWIWENARKELKSYYPVIDDKPTVAYLWARTIPCQDRQQCGATIPLLKTLWVCKKPEKTLKDTPENRNRSDFLHLKKTKNQTKVVINSKRALKLFPNCKTKRVEFEIFAPTDAEDIGNATMFGSTATCPFCGSQQPTDYIKRCGHENEFGIQMTAVVYKEEYGKEYRLPTQEEIIASEISEEALEMMGDQTPQGIPDEPLPGKEKHRAVGSQLPNYGFKAWLDLFTTRQLFALMTFVKWMQVAQVKMEQIGYPSEWIKAISGYLACTFDRMLVSSSNLIVWRPDMEMIGNTFARYAFSMTWDFSECVILSKVPGSYQLCLEKILTSMETIACAHIPETQGCLILHQSATDPVNQEVDAIVTDPPYYDAIPYADISDFFYVWLRRSIGHQFSEFLENVLTPKQKELVQQHKTGEKGRIGKEFYEKGMAESFSAARDSLVDDGRIVIVFAHKEPDAWETLAKAMLEAGLVVTASWPIDTEMQAGLKVKIAALATSL